MARASKKSWPFDPLQAEIGKRLAHIRHARGVTQAALAKHLGTVPAVVSDYERGRLRLHGRALKEISEYLSISADEILGLKNALKKSAAVSRKILRRARRIEHLPTRDQQALLRTIDAFLKGSAE